jgi:fatty-acyl-CoA synthase
VQPRDYPNVWPKHLPTSLTVPQTSLWYNLEVSAVRYPDKAATIFYDSRLTYRELMRDAERLAGHLHRRCGIRRGDRVLLSAQNSPQFIVGYYAILRCGAVVVPIGPMNVTAEIEHYVADSGATTAIVAQDVVERYRPLVGSALAHVVVATYADYLTAPTTVAVPEILTAPRHDAGVPGLVSWHDALAAGDEPDPIAASADDLCAILYTSGTTGRPKGCMHTHRSVMFTAVGGAVWEGVTADAVALDTAPLFHVTGMQHSMNAPIFMGATIVCLPRWDPAAAGDMIERYGCTHWANVPTMVADLLSHPAVTDRDLSSLRNVFGGGSAMPEAVATRLFERCGIEYMEGYGMTETISQTHMNPPGHVRKQCLGIPTFDTESLVIDPDSLRPLGPNERGEIVSRGPQMLVGYWNNPGATQAAFADVGGQRYLRTGDLGYYDEDGYFYIADRLKRMINVAGFKVWPAEVEMSLYTHPDVQEVAVVSAPDARRGETVKAFVALKPQSRGEVSGDQIIEWARGRLAAYKVPRSVELVDTLPRSGTGKIQWRALQEREWQRRD